MISNSVYIIVRSFNERTEKICCELIRRNYPSCKFDIINETPFWKALKTGYELGLKNNFTWSIYIDADVLIRKDALNILLRFAENSKRNVSEVHGLILDKFFNVAKPAGVRLYRTKYLERALKILQEQKFEIRPEYSTLLAMQKEGFPWLGIGYVVGLHDFEQFYKDIFRKFFLHFTKHFDKISEIVPYLGSKSKEDKDFEVALWGLAAGIITFDTNNAYPMQIPYEIYDLLKGPEWHEKDLMSFTSEVEVMIDNTIKSYLLNNPIDNFDDRILIKENFKSLSNYKDRNIVLEVQYILGDILQKIGKSIKKRSLLKNFSK